jgi:hypothetical protein
LGIPAAPGAAHAKRSRAAVPAKPQQLRAAQQQPAAAVAAPRTVMEAEALDFGRLPAAQLPDAVRETAAEHRRRGGFQRVLPCPDDPERYGGLFETPRVGNVLVARWAAHAASRA